MTITELHPYIRQFHFRQEPGDPDYGRCLWATVTLDLEKYTLSVMSDCGNFGYGWLPTPDTEAFPLLLCRLDEDYLLRKISSESVFDRELSVEETIQNLPERMKRRARLAAALRDIDNVGEEGFFTACEQLLEEYEVSDSFERISIVKRHPSGATTFAHIFCTQFQPFLRKQFNIRQCRHCGRTFLAQRQSSQFCHRACKEDPTKTCGEYERYKRGLANQQNNAMAKQYKQVYNIMRGRALRSGASMSTIDQFRKDAQAWRKDILSGAKTEAEYLNWLSVLKTAASPVGRTADV